MARILIISPFSPDGQLDGRRIPLRLTLEALNVHSLFVVILNDTSQLYESQSHPFSRLKKIISGVFIRGYYSSEIYPNSLIDALQGKIDDVRPDVVHFESIIFAGILPRLRMGSAKAVISINDAYSLVCLDALFPRAGGVLGIGFRLRKLIEYVNAITLEVKYLDGFDLVRVVSVADVRYLRIISPSLNVISTANAVVQLGKSLAKYNGGARSFCILFGPINSEKIFMLKNFIENYWNPFAAANPRVILHVLGPIDCNVASLFSLNVTYVGFVEDVRNYYEDGWVFINPVAKRCGLINKLIEPMLHGAVVLTTTEAIRNLGDGSVSGRCLVFDGPQSFSRIAEEVVNGCVDLNEVGRLAKSYVDSKFSKDRILGEILGIYGDLL